MSCKLAITSISLGRCYAGHSLVHKLDMARKHGYRGIELFHEDLLGFAAATTATTSTTTTSAAPPGDDDGGGGGTTTTQPTREEQMRAAHAIRALCSERGLAILSLQPFTHYEGLRDRALHARRLDELAFWLRLVRALGADMVQVPSNFLPADQLLASSSSDDDVDDVAVADLRAAADLGLAQDPPVRFAYEALCWGTRCRTWEQSWEVVRQVDRPNFGMLLDTFHVAGGVWADPAEPDGRVVVDDDGVPPSSSLPGHFPPSRTNGANDDDDDDADLDHDHDHDHDHDSAPTRALRASLRRLAATVDARRVFYVQVADAERLLRPLVPGHPLHDPRQPARMSWSRSCRLFYGERDRGAYLPVDEVARAIFGSPKGKKEKGRGGGLGFAGWVSMELFHTRMADTDPEVPEELARRGAEAWERLVRDTGIRCEAREGEQEEQKQEEGV
ncbi:xylose isomerase-like TIM barrel [Xylariaceae sp. FL0804]|nr:xylose isomerase-like TIM barrel [Xylariaceae sp. FL0804]